ncbi:MAG: hypothetical protein KJP00_14200 [Bacteroidia bacterium]|nr:hypothetical protein [Bacteroidia bacterium]
MKKQDDHFGFERKAKKQGRITSVVVHALLLTLGVLPFLQMTPVDLEREIQIVMDFSSGSRQEGKKATPKPSTVKKAIPKPEIKKPKAVQTSTVEETIPVEKQKPVEKSEEVVKETNKDEKPKDVEKPPAIAEEEIAVAGKGAGKEGDGDAVDGSAANGNGRGFIEGTGVLTRAVIARGDTKSLAKVNGTLILKICINKRGLVTYAEWDKEQSSIKDPDIARAALDNVINYRFEKDYNAPSKECGRLTYIFEVN